MEQMNTKVTITITEGLRLALRQSSIHNSLPMDEMIVQILNNYYNGRKKD